MGATLGLKLVKLWKNNFCPLGSEDAAIDDDAVAEDEPADEVDGKADDDVVSSA